MHQKTHIQNGLMNKFIAKRYNWSQFGTDVEMGEQSFYWTSCFKQPPDIKGINGADGKQNSRAKAIPGFLLCYFEVLQGTMMFKNIFW